jgi:hypothetical protein
MSSVITSSIHGRQNEKRTGYLSNSLAGEFGKLDLDALIELTALVF